MTACCYCAETNNSLVLLEEAATVECKTCKLKMHTKCYIVAHTSRTLVCNPADAEAVRCATHDTALTAHDQVQQGKGVDCVPPILAQSLKLRLQPLAKEYEDDKELLAFVPFPAAEDYEPGHDRRFAVIDGNNRIAAITNILKLP